MYCSSDLAAGQRTVVAVTGGGASGTLAVIHLLRVAAAARVPLRIALIDRHGRHGLGQAYATTHPGHLLNSPAAQMSAVAGDPGHLLRWAQDAGAGAGGFLPRAEYGRYLRETLAEAERAARPLATVRHLTSQVVAIREHASGRPLRLHLAADGHIDADIAVLATGNLPPAAPFPVPAGPRYVADPWEPAALDRVRDGSPVVIIGTGLTALDVAIAVAGASPRTVVHAVSRHGLLPRTHRDGAPGGAGHWLPVFGQNAGQVRLGDLLWQVRAAAAGYPGGWQDVVDALRPHVPDLWQRLPLADKRLFLRHVARYWEVHRHRAAPETARRIAALRAGGRLSVIEGQVTGATPAPGGLRVRVRQRGGADRFLAAGWLVNATGPATDIAATTDPLLSSLLRSGLARPDPLGLGLDTGPAGEVLDAGGRPSTALFALGPLLRGCRYETTAVPEIRTQAAALARHLVRGARAQPRRMTAA